MGTQDSVPFGTAIIEGTEAYRLLKEFDYVEEKFFISGLEKV
jgi:hypothetical protein